MNRRVVALVTTALLAVCVTAASAQDTPGQGGGQGGPGGGRRGGFGRGGQFGRMGGRMGGLGLLRYAQVQTELKMTQPQIDQIEPAQQKVQEQMRGLFQGGGGFQQMSPEERQKMFDKVQDLQNAAVNGILDQKQQKRFHQIELNIQGYRALTQKSNQDALGLSADQRAQIAKLVSDERAAQREAFQSLQDGGDRDAARAKMQAAQKSTEEKIGALLTQAQKDKWKELLGDPFILQPTAPGGPAA